LSEPPARAMGQTEGRPTWLRKDPKGQLSKFTMVTSRALPRTPRPGQRVAIPISHRRQYAQPPDAHQLDTAAARGRPGGGQRAGGPRLPIAESSPLYRVRRHCARCSNVPRTPTAAHGLASRIARLARGRSARRGRRRGSRSRIGRHALWRRLGGVVHRLPSAPSGGRLTAAAGQRIGLATKAG
jgi:hypothetical protein